MSELKDLVGKAARYQDSLKLSDKLWCARYGRYVGSPKTWRERLRGDLSGLNTDKWTKRLRELTAALEGGSVIEVFHDTMPFYLRLEAGVGLLEGQVNDRRVFACLAQTGVGKTVSGRRLISQAIARDWNGPRRVFVSALNTWRENKVTILRGLATSLGCTPEASGANAAMDAIVSTLRSDPRTVFIDEAHQGGVMLMRIIKDLVNETPARFVYLALRTEFDRVRSASTGNIVEARQFLRRCLQPVFDIYADGVDVRDVVAYLKSALPSADGAKSVAQDIASLLRCRGNISTLADAVDEATAMCAADDTDPDPLRVLEALRALCGVAQP